MVNKKDIEVSGYIHKNLTPACVGVFKLRDFSMSGNHFEGTSLAPTSNSHTHTYTHII